MQITKLWGTNNDFLTPLLNVQCAQCGKDKGYLFDTYVKPQVKTDIAVGSVGPKQ